MYSYDSRSDSSSVSDVASNAGDDVGSFDISKCEWFDFDKWCRDGRLEEEPQLSTSNLETASPSEPISVVSPHVTDADSTTDELKVEQKIFETPLSNPDFVEPETTVAPPELDAPVDIYSGRNPPANISSGTEDQIQDYCKYLSEYPEPLVRKNISGFFFFIPESRIDEFDDYARFLQQQEQTTYVNDAKSINDYENNWDSQSPNSQNNLPYNTSYLNGASAPSNMAFSSSQPTPAPIMVDNPCPPNTGYNRTPAGVQAYNGGPPASQTNFVPTHSNPIPQYTNDPIYPANSLGSRKREVEVLNPIDAPAKRVASSNSQLTLAPLVNHPGPSNVRYNQTPQLPNVHQPYNGDLPISAQANYIPTQPYPVPQQTNGPVYLAHSLGSRKLKEEALDPIDAPAKQARGLGFYQSQPVGNTRQAQSTSEVHQQAYQNPSNGLRSNMSTSIPVNGSYNQAPQFTGVQHQQYSGNIPVSQANFVPTRSYPISQHTNGPVYPVNSSGSRKRKADAFDSIDAPAKRDRASYQSVGYTQQPQSIPEVYQRAYQGPSNSSHSNMSNLNLPVNGFQFGPQASQALNNPYFAAPTTFSAAPGPSNVPNSSVSTGLPVNGLKAVPRQVNEPYYAAPTTFSSAPHQNFNSPDVVPPANSLGSEAQPPNQFGQFLVVPQDPQLNGSTGWATDGFAGIHLTESAQWRP